MFGSAMNPAESCWSGTRPQTIVALRSDIFFVTSNVSLGSLSTSCVPVISNDGNQSSAKWGACPRRPQFITGTPAQDKGNVAITESRTEQGVIDRRAGK